MMMRDILQAFEENVRNKARSQFVDPDALVRMDKAITVLWEACDEDYAQVQYLMHWAFCEQFLDYGWEEDERGNG